MIWIRDLFLERVTKYKDMDFTQVGRCSIKAVLVHHGANVGGELKVAIDTSIVHWLKNEFLMK